MPILTTSSLIQPIVDELGKAYKDATNIADASRTDIEEPSALIAVRRVREAVYDAIGDIIDDTDFENTLALANTIRGVEKNLSAQSSGLVVGAARALEANLKHVTGIKFRKKFDGINEDTNVTFSDDFKKLWMAANNELLCTELVRHTSDGSGWTLEPLGPFPILIADPRDEDVLIASSLEVRVAKLGANAIVKITGDTSTATNVTASVAVNTKVSGGEDVRYNASLIFKRITNVVIRNAGDTAAYNGANTDALSIWID